MGSHAEVAESATGGRDFTPRHEGHEVSGKGPRAKVAGGATEEKKGRSQVSGLRSSVSGLRFSASRPLSFSRLFSYTPASILLSTWGNRSAGPLGPGNPKIGSLQTRGGNEHIHSKGGRHGARRGSVGPDHGSRGAIADGARARDRHGGAHRPPGGRCAGNHDHRPGGRDAALAGTLEWVRENAEIFKS